MPKEYIVVDENDTIVCYKADKKDIDPLKERYRVSSLRLTNSHWEILIAQRWSHKSHNPGKRWTAVAWTIEKGETYEQAIIREIHEELWLENLILTTWPKFKRQGEYNFFVQRFFATVDKEVSESTIQKEEVEAIKRISKEKLTKDIELHPENYLGNMKIHVKEFN